MASSTSADHFEHGRLRTLDAFQEIPDAGQDPFAEAPEEDRILVHVHAEDGMGRWPYLATREEVTAAGDRYTVLEDPASPETIRKMKEA